MHQTVKGEIMEYQQWLKWRQKGIGSSDAPIIMGVSPWKTPLELYEEKIHPQTYDGAQQEKENSFITRMGNSMEPRIRALFEFKMGQDFRPSLLEMEQFPFLRASLDGASDCRTLICEIKLMGKKDWESSTVPEKYIYQVQHQLMVSRAEKCFFVKYLYEKGGNADINPEKMRIIPVVPDQQLIGTMLEAEMKFWDAVINKRPPMPSGKDYKTLKGLEQTVNQYLKIEEQIEELTKIRDAIRNSLIESAEKQGHNRYTVGTIKIQKESRAGTVDYKKIDAIKKMSEEELNQYRKLGTSYWKIYQEKKNEQTT